ncbi:MAG: FAD-binding oxidoreductase [Methylobacteriaceae bacterium]|nr:FAD-binding oxidoreductase [Methylobacteriaceae bacterium]
MGDANPDVVVIGTGIIGSFVAYELAKLGMRLLVIDRAGLAPGHIARQRRQSPDERQIAGGALRSHA